MLSRLAIVGTSGSGKTTLARQLSSLLGSVHIELDALRWRQNWTLTSAAELTRLVADAIASTPRWIFDGNHPALQDMVWEQATAVIWLNYGFPLVFSRALRRTIRQVVMREGLCGGNRETFRRAFLSRDSNLWWVICQ